jgi:hypothetical protein
MLLFSWDNLSTKGALHERPDLMFVWNERQRQEAVELHDFPGDRVVVAGAPRFDEFFALEPRVTREAFFAPLGLDPGRPALLYLCSSRFIAARELEFIRTWLATLRASGPPLDRCTVIVRPHPDVELVEGRSGTRGRSPGGRCGRRPAGSSGRSTIRAALVLRTTYGTPQAFFECLHHARAVVALNTSASSRRASAGRPVYTVLSTDEAPTGQANTIHFNYLLREHGGFVHYAPDSPATSDSWRGAERAPDTSSIRAFIGAFLRPLGDRPVAPALARMLADRAATARPEAVVRAAPAERPDRFRTRGSRSGDVLDATSRGDAAARHRRRGTRLYASAAIRRLPGTAW